MDQASIFKARKEKFSAIYDSYERKHGLISALRVVLFLLTVFLVVIFANVRNTEGIGFTLLGFALFFTFVVIYHKRLTQKRDMAQSIAVINEQEIHRLQGQYDNIPTGSKFADKSHPYVSDLDIFGQNSIYQMIQRVVTPSGEDHLADWLSHPAVKTEIEQRQEAVKELTPQLDWRQEFQACGMKKNNVEVDARPLLQWINEPNQVLDNSLIKAGAFILPAITIGFILSTVFLGVSIYFTVGALIINALVLKRFKEYVINLTEKTFNSFQVLHSYGHMISSLENHTFKSTLLRHLQHAFIHEDTTASRSILRLQKILDYLQARSNAFYLFFNMFLLFDLHIVFRAERWKKNQQADVNQWFDNIGQFETLNSFAGFAFANPDFILPTVSDEDYVLRACGLGHPLIQPTERVRNHLDMAGQGTVNIITGSNMSGKSTFLRTVGVNAVIALAGGPVCAKEMTISRLHLFTGMRTEDNLEEHVSSFYAELKRIRFLLDMLDKKELPVLFMLDEILKGTNSQDRHRGAAALIKQVSDTGSMGFVSTHDLELGKLAERDSRIHNYSFNSRIDGDKIIFNYQLEEGLCHSFNASKLMENIGIKIGKADQPEIN